MVKSFWFYYFFNDFLIYLFFQFQNVVVRGVRPEAAQHLQGLGLDRRGLDAQVLEPEVVVRRLVVNQILINRNK